MEAKTGGTHHLLVKKGNTHKRHKNALRVEVRHGGGNDEGGIPKEQRLHGCEMSVTMVTLELDLRDRPHLRCRVAWGI